MSRSYYSKQILQSIIIHIIGINFEESNLMNVLLNSIKTINDVYDLEMIESHMNQKKLYNGLMRHIYSEILC